MKLNILVWCALVILCAAAAHAEIAVIPYKINNPSSSFPERTGEEYSRLLGVASIIAKEDIEITAPREVALDLERHRLSPQEVITRDDLDLLGRTRHIDYFLTGVITRAGKEYRSESIMYSVRERRIVARARVEAGDLFKLAEKEVAQTLGQYRNRDRGNSGGDAFDAVFLLDLSYRVNQDWAAVREAVVDFASKSIDTARADTRIYLIPFSDRMDIPSASVSSNSISGVRSELEKLKPVGGPSSENFTRSLQYAVRSVRWRPGAKKMIIIISNSKIEARNPEKYGVIARDRGIPILSIALGQIAGEECEAYERLSSITGGSHIHAAYHRRVFNPSAESTELYLENGRLFRSSFAESDWRTGLYEKKKGGRPGRPKSFLEEVFITGKKISLAPHTMGDAYARVTMERVMSQETLESNISKLLLDSRILSRLSRKSASKKVIGKALISDGTVSLWVHIDTDAALSFLENSGKNGFSVPLGVLVKADSSVAYGITLVPRVTGLSPDYVPDMIKVKLGDLVRKGDYYRSKGLYFPPVWFVSVKVESVERIRGRNDVRGE